MPKLIPPFLFLFCLITMLGLNYFYPIKQLLGIPSNLFGIIPLALGIFMTVSTSKRFRKIKTQIHTFKKPNKLITNELFQYTRNPIYLGFTIALLGIAILLGSAATFIPVFFFFLAANFWYIPFEEKNMQTVFGQDYLFYKRKVRRWL